MKNHKYWFQAFALVATLIFSSIACTAPYSNIESYKENIVTIYASEDGEKFALVGKEYHYIFNISKEKYANLFQQSRPLNYTTNNFDLSLNKETNETISLNMHFEFKADQLNEEQKSWLEANEFYKLKRKDNIDTNLYTGGVFLSGKRYLSSNISQKLTPLKKPIKIEVIEIDSSNSATQTPLRIEDNFLELNGTILYYLFKKEE